MAEETIGNYRLLGELGRGGMGIIYKAEQKKLGRFVALKVLYPHLVSDPITVKRFNHEARATALLNHPNIVQIFDVGVEEDMHYFAMEYVPGKTLEAVLENRGKLGAEETFRVVDQAAAAISAAHDVGIIHRDVKPSNVLIDDHGKIKVSDFGIAIAAGQGDLTDTGHLVGTARYMSPEHARGEHLDSRSDIYSLGIVMYEMLSGRLPFDGDSPLVVLEQHVSAPIPPMPSDVPPMVQALVLRCLEKRRVDRFRTVRDFRLELREAVEEIHWQGPALPPLEPSETGFEHDPSFRYDRAGITHSMTDTVSFCLAERLRPAKGFRGRLGRRLSNWLGRRIRHRHDSCKMKRLEVMELRENLRRAEQQLEQVKRKCDRAHENYEAADEELHGWQMEGSLSLDRGKKFSREAAAIHEKRLWQQLASYRNQWETLQDQVRDWYQNVERARRDLKAAVKELELLKLRRRRTAEESGVARRNLVRCIFTVGLIGAIGLAVLYHTVFRSTYTYHEGMGDFVYGKFLTVGMMKEARDEHAAALLDSGDVLIAGGIDANRAALGSAEIFDVLRRKFSPTGGLRQARFNHTMTTLAAGKGILVVGGEKQYKGADALASAELFRESDGQFMLVSRLRAGRTRHRSVLLKNGKVLVSGGGDERGKTLKSAELFDPNTNSFRPVAWMNSARKDHTMTLMSDGRVLVVGGSRAGNLAIDGVEVFDPKTECFETVCALSHARYEHTATALDGNRVLIVGGRTGQRIEDTLDTIELIDVERRSSTVVARLRLPRRVHTTVLLPGSSPERVLIVGGAAGRAGQRNLCERFAVGWKETEVAGTLSHDRNNHTAALLASGAVLFAGGYGHNTGEPLRIAELYVKVPASPGAPPGGKPAAE